MRVAPLEMDANSRPSTSATSEPAFVELEEADIPGAALDEPKPRSERLLDVILLFCAGGSSVVESSFYNHGKSNMISRFGPLTNI